MIMTLPVAVPVAVAMAFPVGFWFGGMAINPGQVRLVRMALAPWLAVFLANHARIYRWSLRAMAATKGLVLAARWSGKIKATVQGVAMITTLLLPVLCLAGRPGICTWGRGVVLDRCLVIDLFDYRVLGGE